MTTTDTRIRWLDTYRQLTDTADAIRDSQSVAFGLLGAYDQLSPAERVDIHQVLAEWLESDDNKRRYDAEFLTSQRRIVGMAPAVEEAIQRIDESSGPEARNEVKKLRRILRELS